MDGRYLSRCGVRPGENYEAIGAERSVDTHEWIDDEHVLEETLDLRLIGLPERRRRRARAVVELYPLRGPGKSESALT